MRTEGNPVKENPTLPGGYKLHRIIVPVYIPEHDGYYRDAFRIFEISLQSLINTTDRSRVNISIINNACVPEVDELVRRKLAAGEVDQYVYNQVNRGKADAIVGLAKASYEPFITIADADVLFLTSWIDEIEKVYKVFPSAGVICPFPAPHLKFHYTASTWLNFIFQIRFGSAVHTNQLELFEKNLGLINYFKPIDLVRQFYIRKKGVRALVGAGHFVATYRNFVFKGLQFNPTLFGLKGGLKSIERRVDRLGFARLSLLENKVLHMGNAWEVWMTLDNSKHSFNEQNELKTKSRTLMIIIPYFFRSIFERTITYLFFFLVKIGVLK